MLAPRTMAGSTGRPSKHSSRNTIWYATMRHGHRGHDAGTDCHCGPIILARFRSQSIGSTGQATVNFAATPGEHLGPPGTQVMLLHPFCNRIVIVAQDPKEIQQ